MMPRLLYDQFILFGDSITQQSGDQSRGFGFAPALQNAYIRRLDVVNRGFSGYNTAQALKVLPSFIPSPEEARIRFMTVFFCANDARLPDTTGPAQSVALEEYEKNLAAIITHPAVKAHNPRVVLITPPPVDERLCEAGDLLKGTDEVRRTAENTASYAAAARRVGEELGVPVLDLWSSFMSAAGWSAGEPLPGSKAVAQSILLNELLHDGLHFNPKGYTILFEEMMKLVAENWPDQVPDVLPFVLPAWDSATAWQDD